jgi:hypothetical protein
MKEKFWQYGQWNVPKVPALHRNNKNNKTNCTSIKVAKREHLCASRNIIKPVEHRNTI